jgi:AhpD family alkylhydroperoxidase
MTDTSTGTAAPRRTRHYSYTELYEAMVLGHRSLGAFGRQRFGRRRPKVLDPRFVERLMMAVTEVNQCAACAYAHSRLALREGMASEEVLAFSSGDPRFIRADEAVAIAFAQHYADARGKVDRRAYGQVLDTYGPEETNVIVAAIQLMMIGNILGIPLSALLARLKGHSEPGSTVLYELTLPLSALVLLIPSLVQSLLDQLRHEEQLVFG